MITKTKRLKYIGKFYNFSAKGPDVDWHRNTFVFAPNAYGKTTLVSVFRSLRDNEPNRIRARKTLGASNKQEAVIIVDGVNHVFDGIKWDKPCPSIQIFDTPYILANILTSEIEHEHKKNLHRIIVGSQGVVLAEELAVLKIKEKGITQELSTLVAQFNRGSFSSELEAFLAIPPEEEAKVVCRIIKIEQNIKSKQSEAVIQGLAFPASLASPSFDLPIVKATASERLAAVHDASEKRVMDHLERNTRNQILGRSFIRQGLDLIQEDCPFCGQDLKSAAELLHAYREFFDDAFKDSQKRIAQQITSFGAWNLENDFTMLVSTYNANLAIFKHWEPYLTPAVLPDVVVIIDKYREKSIKHKEEILTALRTKQQNPTTLVDLAPIDALGVELESIAEIIKFYNNEISCFTDKAKDYIAAVPKSDVSTLTSDLKIQQEIKKRFEPEWKKWATEYRRIIDESKFISVKKNEKQYELEIYSKSIFDKYQKRINELLIRMGTDFTLTGLAGKTDDRANASYSDFSFLILEQTVPLSARKEDAPSFKNTLSEGDKSTLAFAFFLAAIENTPNLDKQIVIFDDPLSSLDETRREATAGLLLGLSPLVNQLAVFTHKQDFIFMLCDKIHEYQTLQIRSDKKNGSSIEPFDVDETRKSEHARRIEDMERYIDEDFGPTPENMRANLRLLFEVVLKTKYYLPLIKNIKDKRGFAAILTTLFQENLLSPDLKPKLFDMCSLANGPHHGEIVDSTVKKLSRDELIPLIRDALSLVHKI